MTLPASGQISINDLREEFGIPKRWIALSANPNTATSSAIDDNYVLWTWGSNCCGQIGDGTTLERLSPVSVIGGFADWIDVSTGGNHTVGLRSNGTIWTWGLNNLGQLGTGFVAARSSPSLVIGGIDNWCNISAGWCHTMAIRTDGTLWGWGNNANAELGDSTTIPKSSPVQVVGGITNWCQVSAGWSQTAAVRSNGTLWTWGTGSFGELGDNTVIAKSSPVQVVGGITSWCKTSASISNTAGITTAGQIYTWGSASFAKLGLNSAVNRSSPTLIVGTPWSDVCMGTVAVLAKKSDGTLWSWGVNSGNLGDGTTIVRSSPVAVLSNKAWNLISLGRRPFVTDSDNILYSWGADSRDAITDPGNTVFTPKKIDLLVPTGSAQLSCFYLGGPSVPCISKNLTLPVSGEIALSDFYNTGGDTSEVYRWGSNSNGQLGVNCGLGLYSSLSPVKVSGNFTDWSAISGTMALKKDGTVWTWGINNRGQLGNNSSIRQSSPVSIIGGFTDWVCIAITSGQNNHNAAIRSNGTLWTWGFNLFGALGDGTTVSKSSPVSVLGGFTDWCQVSVGSYTTAAVRNSGTLWTWGSNSGQLGDGTTIFRSSPILVLGGFTDWCQASTGGNHILAVRRDGSAWAWGFNYSGRLGDGTTINKSSPVAVLGVINQFCKWCQVSAGANNSAVVRTDGTIWTWGYNTQGRLGDGTTIDKSSPVQVAGGITDWCQVSVGFAYSSAVKADGTVWTWGRNDVGSLGTGRAFGYNAIPNKINSLCNVVCVGIRAALTKDRGDTDSQILSTAFSWGRNLNGIIGDNTQISRSSPVSIVGGFTDWCQISAFSNNRHVLGLRSNGTIWAWGYNVRGELGNNLTPLLSRFSSPVSVVGGFTDWCQISAGLQHSAAIRKNGTIWMWGCNAQGILGDNTVINRSSPVSVVGGITDWCQVSAGQFHMAALRSNGTIWTWGGNGGRLADGTTIDRSSPVQIVGGITSWCQVSAGLASTMAIISGGRLYAWGSNTLGILGNNSSVFASSPVEVSGLAIDWCCVSLGQNHAVALKTNGTAWAWGCNGYGRLGDNTTINRSSPVSVSGGFNKWCQISAGSLGSAAVTTDGAVWTWGNSSTLGDSGSIICHRSSPISIVGGLTNWCQVCIGGYSAHAIRSI